MFNEIVSFCAEKNLAELFLVHKKVQWHLTNMTITDKRVWKKLGKRERVREFEMFVFETFKSDSKLNTKAIILTDKSLHQIVLYFINWCSYQG